MSLSIAIVQGGPTSEAEVSRASARSVERALIEAGHRVAKFELDASLAESLRTGSFDVVYPVVHGAVGEDGSLQGLLEVLNLPYVGSGVLASALAMHKQMAKIVFAKAGLPIAKEILVTRGTNTAEAAQRVLRELGNKVVVKPCSNGSSFGVALFSNGASADEIAKAIEGACEVDDMILVEEFKQGREVTCGVLDAGGPARAFSPTEIRPPEDKFYDYQAKYGANGAKHLCPAPLGDVLTKRVQELAIAAHRALGCRDLSRADFVVPESGEPTLLEVNTLPGFTDVSLYPEAAQVAGIKMAELCNGFVQAAMGRGPSRRNAGVPLPK
jgi:D-alanine-D-alanine ligase